MVNPCFVIFSTQPSKNGAGGRKVREEKRNLCVLSGLRGSFSEFEKAIRYGLKCLDDIPGLLDMHPVMLGHEANDFLKMRWPKDGVTGL